MLEFGCLTDRLLSAGHDVVQIQFRLLHLLGEVNVPDLSWIRSFFDIDSNKFGQQRLPTFSAYLLAA